MITCRKPYIFTDLPHVFPQPRCTLQVDLIQMDDLLTAVPLALRLSCQLIYGKFAVCLQTLAIVTYMLFSDVIFIRERVAYFLSEGGGGHISRRS